MKFKLSTLGKIRSANNMPLVVVIVCACALGLTAPASPAQTPVEAAVNARFTSFLFGVDYYPEQTPESLWEQDAQQMQQAGVNTVRIAEFGWSVMEPAEGKFDFSLFDRAIDILSHHGIKIILGTPTAAPPKWLTHNYPEVLHVFADGQKSNDQTRRHTCYNSTVYRQFSRKIVEAMVNHYQSNANVIGWQIDNEFNNENSECYSDSCRVAFRKFLQTKYGSLDALNERWGNRFWSQWYTAWDQVDLPFPATSLQNPALMLDFRRFISDSVTSYAAEQIAIIRAHRPHDFITTNGVFRNIDYYSFSKTFDIFAQDNYPTFEASPQYSTGSNLTMVRGLNGRMMIMEELTGAAGQTYLLRTPRPGEMSLWTFQAIAHGADGVLHFRWNTALRGVEEYWSGVLDQDNVPGAKFAEFKREGHEIGAIAPEIENSKLISQIAVLNDFEDAWVFDYQYLSRDLNSGAAYTNLFQAASELKFNIDFVGPDADFNKYRVIFAPRLTLIDPAAAQKIRSFVEQGGTFILAAHGAIQDRDSALIPEPRPALLASLFGVQVQNTQIFSPQTQASQSMRLADGKTIPSGLLAEDLKIEDLKIDGASVVGTWDGGFFHGEPAYTERSSGKGNAVYFGSLFTLDAARFLVQRFAARAGLQPLLAGIPKNVEVTCRTKGDSDYFFVLNHEDLTVEVNPGPGYFSLLERKTAPIRFSLGPFQYSVLRKTRTAAHSGSAADLNSRGQQ